MDALSRLDNRALGEEVLRQLRDVLSSARSDRPTDSWKDPVTAAKSVALARALYESRRISTQDYVFFAVSPVTGVHEGRWMDGDYERELGPISQGLEAIREEHGL